MKTEDFSHKAITNSGNGEAFADIARNVWDKQDKGSAGPSNDKSAGNFGTASADKIQSQTGQSGSATVGDSPATEKSGNSSDKQPGGGGYSPNQGGERNSEKSGNAAVGESGGNAQAERARAGAADEVQKGGHAQGHKAGERNSGTTDMQPAGSEARGAKGTKLNPANGEGAHSEGTGKKADASVGHLPSLSLVM